MNNYLILRPDGTQEGPIEESTLRTLMAAAHYPAGTMAWCEGMSEWQALENIEALRPEALPEATEPPPTRQARLARLRTRKNILLSAALLVFFLLLALTLRWVCGPIIRSDDDARDFYDAKIAELKAQGDKTWKILQKNRFEFRKKLRGENAKDQEFVLVFFASCNSRDGIDYCLDERAFSPTPKMLNSAAFSGHLGLLRYLMEERDIMPNKYLLSSAASCQPAKNADAESALEVLRYLVEEQGMEPDSEALEAATHNLPCLRYLVETCDIKPSIGVLRAASFYAKIRVLRYLTKQGLKPDAEAMQRAAWGGNIDALKYYTEEFGMELTPEHLTEAAQSGELRTVQFLVEDKGIKPEENLPYKLACGCIYTDEEEKNAQVEVARYLIGFFPSMKRPNNEALRYCEEKHPELAELLQSLDEQD